MMAAVLLGGRASAVAALELDDLGADQVLVRIEGCGVCASNLPVWQGRPWFKYPLAAGLPGHEPWGRVAGAGAQARRAFAVGERVTGLGARAFAEYEIVDAARLVPVPQALDDRPVPGEALGCVLNIFERARIEPGMRVAVIGAGFIGCGLVQLATAAGARVTAFSRRAWSREQAREQGAVDARPLGEIVDRDAWPRVVECTGTQEALDLAGALVAPGGRLVIAGYHQDGLRTVNMQEWNWKGIGVVNAHERDVRRNLAGIRASLAAIVERRLDPWPLLSHRYRLADLDAAFTALEQRPDGFVKAYVTL